MRKKGVKKRTSLSANTLYDITRILQLISGVDLLLACSLSCYRSDTVQACTDMPGIHVKTQYVPLRSSTVEVRVQRCRTFDV